MRQSHTCLSAVARSVAPNNALEQRAARSFGEVAGMLKLRIKCLRSAAEMPRVTNADVRLARRESMIKLIFLFALILSSACGANGNRPGQNYIIGSGASSKCGGGGAPLGCYDPTPDPCLLTDANLRRCEQDHAPVPVQRGNKTSGAVSTSSNQPASPGGGNDSKSL